MTQNGGRKRIFILFFCVIPPSQYPPSGFAGHLLINKEAYPIPILPVRIPFLNTVANPLLALWMTPYRLPSFWTVARKPCGKDGKWNGESEWRIYYPNDVLPLSSPWIQILHIRSGWRLTALYRDHGVGRQKDLLAHVVRLRILACRNDLNRKRIVSLQLTANSLQLTANGSQLTANS